jgi:hypothetical protein
MAAGVEGGPAHTCTYLPSCMRRPEPLSLFASSCCRVPGGCQASPQATCWHKPGWVLPAALVARPCPLTAAP